MGEEAVGDLPLLPVDLSVYMNLYKIKPSTLK